MPNSWRSKPLPGSANARANGFRARGLAAASPADNRVSRGGTGVVRFNVPAVLYGVYFGVVAELPAVEHAPAPLPILLTEQSWARGVRGGRPGHGGRRDHRFAPDRRG